MCAYVYFFHKTYFLFSFSHHFFDLENSIFLSASKYLLNFFSNRLWLVNTVWKHYRSKFCTNFLFRFLLKRQKRRMGPLKCIRYGGFKTPVKNDSTDECTDSNHQKKLIFIQRRVKANSPSITTTSSQSLFRSLRRIYLSFLQKLLFDNAVI